MRRLLVGMVAGLVVAATAPSAWAKCDPNAGLEDGGCVRITSADATISGPGLGTPVHISGPRVFDIARQAGINSYRPYHYDGDQFFPGQDGLGPRYELRIAVATSTGRTFDVVADLYPYAENLAVPGAPSAWVRLPAGAKVPMAERIEGRLFFFGVATGEAGWWKSGALYYTLVGEGLPAEPPVEAAEPAPVEAAEPAPAGKQPVGSGSGSAAREVAASSEGIPAGVRAGLVVGILAAVLAAAALAGRRSRGAIA